MIYREQAMRFLQEKQEKNGGYTGNDLTALAELLNVTPQGLRKRLSTWIKTDKDFSKFISVVYKKHGYFLI